MRLLLGLIPFFIVAGFASAQEPIQYRLYFPQLEDHQLHVEATYPADGQEKITIKMARWTAYTFRDYADRILQLRTAHPFTRIQKNRWEIKTNGEKYVKVHYSIQADSIHVQDNFVGPDFALINGQPTFLTLADDQDRPHHVMVTLPDSWKTCITPLKETAAHQYRANDYEELTDSPFILGNPRVHEFQVEGIRHRIVNIQDQGNWDIQQTTADLTRMITEQKKIWGSLPVQEYIFFNILSGRGGGMEHMNAAVMMASPRTSQTRSAYVRWLDLASHEYFHLWNVKRLRPREIKPGEYEMEQYTPSLGIAEGFTTYYSWLTLRRAGVIDDGEFFEALSQLSASLMQSKARKVQTLAEASLNVWSVGSGRSREKSISYYTKGALVAFLLDAHLRKQSDHSRSLDDVMQEMWRKYPFEQGYSLNDFEQVAGVSLHSWFHTTEELDFSEAAELYGLDINASGQISLRTETTARKAWLLSKQ